MDKIYLLSSIHWMAELFYLQKGEESFEKGPQPQMLDYISSVQRSRCLRRISTHESCSFDLWQCCSPQCCQRRHAKLHLQRPVPKCCCCSSRSQRRSESALPLLWCSTIWGCTCTRGKDTGFPRLLVAELWGFLRTHSVPLSSKTS